LKRRPGGRKATRATDQQYVWGSKEECSKGVLPGIKNWVPKEKPKNQDGKATHGSMPGKEGNQRGKQGHRKDPWKKKERSKGPPNMKKEKKKRKLCQRPKGKQAPSTLFWGSPLGGEKGER